MRAFFVGVVCLSVSASAAGCAEGPAVVQPIPFNHRIHKENGLTCDFCHEGVREGAHAGIPRVVACMNCHETDITENPAAKPYIEAVRRHANQATEIPWVQLYSLPAHVYYTHRRHVAIAGFECAQCHGDIGERVTPAERPIAQTLNMDTCMDCHEARGVDNDCAWCHR